MNKDRSQVMLGDYCYFRKYDDGIKYLGVQSEYKYGKMLINEYVTN